MTLCAALLLPAPLTACQQPPPTPGFAAHHEEPAPADRAAAAALEQHRIVDTVTADLNTHCPHTWSRTRDAWLKDLPPLLRA
ncbi:hypothetical protein [Streptomyces yangpuensis]|uniref:hypothetical protein n=1 Tax=Streptomyces yangpuensis TaxID=1648182 RepID=UPI0037135C8B